jgi:hypothetical protein
MRRLVIHALIAALLIASGWVAAKAQSAAPDFEIVVSAPAGETTIECKRGCDLAWVERGVNPNAIPSPAFTFSCSGASVQRCSSATVGGWLKD